VGHRLALLAEQIAYGKPLNASGPLFLRADVEGANIRLRFSSKQLVCKSPCAGFELAGEDHHFVSAEASVQGDSVLVNAATILHPGYVRYAWANAPVASLFLLRHDACANFTLLSAIGRENRAMSQVTKERVHPAWNTAFAG